MFHDDLNPIILFCTVLFFWPCRSLHDQDLTFSLHALPCKSWLLCKVSAALYTFTMAIPSLLYLDHVDPQTIPSLLYLDHGDPQKTIPWPWRSPAFYTLTMAIPRRSRSSSISSSWSRVSRVFLPPRLSKFYVTHQKSYPRGKSPRALRRHYKSCSTAAAKVRSLKEQRFVFSKNNCGRIHPDPWVVNLSIFELGFDFTEKTELDKLIAKTE